MTTNKPYCYVLQDAVGRMRYPLRFRPPVEACQQAGEVVLELYLKEPSDKGLTHDPDSIKT
jgi:hypothetical protein